MLPKQDVTGSNPATRSTKANQRSCFKKNGIGVRDVPARSKTPSAGGGKTFSAALAAYEIAGRASGLSQATIGHAIRCVRYFERWLGEGACLLNIGADEFRAFLSDLRTRR